MRSVVDLDDPATWPESVVAEARRLADQVGGTTDYAADLDLWDDEDRFRSLFVGRPLRAYHCTRLLPIEVDALRVEGLRPLSQDLVRDRLRRANESGAIDANERERLLTGSEVIWADRRQRERLGQVCAILGTSAFENHIEGLWRLLSTWGGEAIYMPQEQHRLYRRLKEIGAPAVVVLALDLSDGSSTHHAGPGVAHLFVGSVLGLDDLNADVHFFAPVHASDILDVWQPGSADYDRFGELPG